MTNAKLANVATSTIKGRVTAGTGDPEDLTSTQATTLINEFTSSLKGLAPASGGGTTNYLRADGTWAQPPGTGGGGAPTDADYLVKTANGSLSAERVVTDSTSITVNWATAGQVSWERAALTGDVTASQNSNSTTIANDAVTNSKLANMTASTIKARVTASTGDPEDASLTQVLDLVGSVTYGDILYRDSTSWARLPAGTSGHYLQTQGASAAPTWAAVSSGGGGGTKTYSVFTPLSNQPPAVSFATLDTRNSVAVLDFDDGATSEVAVFLGVMPEAASVGSGLKVRIHWAATSATSGNVEWAAQFERLVTDIDADSFDTAVSVTTTTSATSGVPNITEISTTYIDSVTGGDGFRLKIYRDSADTTNDTMVGDAELIAVEVRSAS